MNLIRSASFAIVAAFAALSSVADPAMAQTVVVADCAAAGTIYAAGQGGRPIIIDLTGKQCVTASVSVSGFAPGGTFATLTASGSSGSVALPAGAVVIFDNTGTTAVSCTLGVGSATALASENIIQPSSWKAFTVGSNTFGACIDQTGSASNVVVLSGGAGIPTGAGGGSISGGGATTIADGAAVNLGALADAAWVSGNGTITSILKNIAGGVAGAIPDCGATPCTNKIGVVGVNTWGGGVLGAMANYGTSPGAVLVPGVNAFATNFPATVSTGTGAQGASSPRFTVATDQATNAGAALVNGGVGVVNGGSAYETVAASQTAQVLGPTGATGDYLSHCVVYPTSISPGVVTVFDNANAAGTNVIAFAGGASSVSNLVPFSFPVGALSTAGAWKATTGANLVLTCYGRFTLDFNLGLLPLIG